MVNDNIVIVPAVEKSQMAETTQAGPHQYTMHKQFI